MQKLSIRETKSVRALCAILGLSLAPACAPLTGEELDGSEFGAEESGEIEGTSAALVLPRLQLINWERAGVVPLPEEHQLNAQAVALDGNNALVSYDPSVGEEFVEQYRTWTFPFQGKQIRIWNHVARIPGRGGNHEYFGTSVSADAGMLAIGSPGDGNDYHPGSVYQYEKVGDTYTIRDEITPPFSDIRTGHWDVRFGQAVNLSNDMLVVGAPGSYRTQGRAYVYERLFQTFILLDTLEPTTGDVDLSFGKQVASLGNFVIVSEPGGTNDSDSEKDGRLWIYKRDGNSWNHHQMIELDSDPRDPFEHVPDYFGLAFAASGNRIAARSQNGVHVYELRNGRFEYVWTRNAYQAGKPEAGTVAMDGSSILVGYPDATDGGEERAGLVMSYAHNNELLAIRLGSGAPADRRRFGHALALDGDLTVIADRYDDGGLGAGKAHPFERKSGAP